MALKDIMLRHGTDKVQGHSYADIYKWYFEPHRYRDVSLLEIGVGGYSDPNAGGHSLRAWKEYFPYGDIVSFDIVNKTSLMEDRITIYQGSQADNVFLQSLIDTIGMPNIIIDDGSHVNAHVISTFQFLFPNLQDGGIYVVEDVQTSYFPELRGGSQTTMEYFKGLLDGLNYREREGYYNHTYFDKNIVWIHFYHNLIFIGKGNNREESNTLKDNKR